MSDFADEQRKPQQIAQQLRCSDQCVRDAIHAFELAGIDCLETRSRARHTPQATFDQAGVDWLKGVLRQSPRTFGYDRSLWTRKLLAQLAYEQGVSDRIVRPETVGRALAQAGIRWQRAKQWIHSPDVDYARKKSGETG